MRKNKYSNFKIFAIQPLKNCKSNLLKVLAEDEIYYLSNDYNIDETGKLNYSMSYPNNLYNAFNLRLNFCAIAGKNGSGKSTLIELLLMAINNIAYYFQLKNDLQIVNGLKVALYIQSDTCFKIIIDGGNLAIQNWNEAGTIQLSDDSEQLINKLKGLFYTICMNYSHYAYNYKDYMGKGQPDWLSPLFHKNDAYQTPLVINPWRDNGDIIIARENSLIQSRLIANLLRPDGQSEYSFRKVTDNLRAYALDLKLDTSKVYDGELYRRSSAEKNDTKFVSVSYAKLDQLRKDEILFKINREYDFNLEKYRKNGDQIAQVAMDYLIRKLISISIKYEEYSGFYIIEQDNFDYKKLNDYIRRITRDRSHIAFKLRQTLNFLRHRHIDNELNDLKLDVLSKNIQDIINEKPNYRDQIIELIPPPIYTIDIILQPITGKNEKIKLTTLSSGEKQMIYSLSSILYHLFNLDSVSPKSKTKVKYRTVQIILEEIELYFHPEMQRRYLKFLRESIIRLGLEYIRDINICFVTHSPFILSDIPDSNVLFLQIKDSKTIQVNQYRKTFAANIHDLLADVFFMDDGVCGAFAIDKINNTIEFLNNCALKNELLIKIESDPNNKKLLDKLEFLEFEMSNELPEEHALLVENIGEPVIKTKLQEMYDDAFPNLNRRKKILAEIDRLQKLL